MGGNGGERRTRRGKDRRVQPDRRSSQAEPQPRYSTRSILRWIYIGRMTLAGGIFGGALVVWEEAVPFDTLVATVVFVSALLVTVWGVADRYRQPGPPRRSFLYSQVTFDTVMISAVVHITGGVGSIFAALYIPVIAVAAVILPFPGVAFIGGLCVLLYLTDAVWGQGMDAFSGTMFLQLGLFGVVAGIAGVLGDRLRRTGTALGAVESELRRLRLDTSEVLATVSSGVLTVDEGERLVYMNPAGEALLGVDARQWMGAPVLNRVAEVAPELSALFRRSFEKGRPFYRETATAARDGERIILGVATTLREAEGEPRAVTAIFQDITDSQRLAMLDRQNERLEAVAELAASMAHEIRNPLASIQSAVEQFTSPRISDEDREKLSKMVVRESTRLSRLLSDFIDFSRVRMDQRERLDLVELVADVTTVVCQHPAAERCEVELRTEEAPSSLVVEGDPDVLHRALLNLLLNAVQFSPDGETVKVRVEDLRGDGRAPELGVERPVRVRVRDHGPGVPADLVNRLFDPFFTTREGGSGLGLAMVHRAAEAHGGAIVLEHPEGGGAEFILYLPAAGAEPNGDQAPSAGLSEGEGRPDGTAAGASRETAERSGTEAGPPRARPGESNPDAANTKAGARDVGA